MEGVCQREGSALYFRDQVDYFYQIHEPHDKPITATDRMKAKTRRRTQNLQSKATKTFHVKKVLRKEMKRLSVKGRKYTN